ncbi:hypothetical protein CWO17_11425 [Vibrio sp. 10N.286.45.A3]|uniref:helix-turn-helix domain-containing protein n=1 Tax=Vibrio sp. 10N.286.45.A3 TaxID=2056188 RepID=UPI000D3399F9|nr:hypothetical protein CWO17_11425 [Vibrio sp. 10N.286.45.A3]TKE74770.1 transposase [Vibrio sp. F12]TKE96221.1 transposase [Vibrio sp. F12]
MLTPDEIKNLALSLSDSRLKTRYLAVHYFELGHNRVQIAQLLGVSKDSVNAWIKNYHNHGLDGLKSKKQTGRPTLLKEEQLSRLSEYLESNFVNDQVRLFMAEDVRRYIKTEFNVSYASRNVYRLVHALGFSFIISRSKRPTQSLEEFKRRLTR